MKNMWIRIFLVLILTLATGCSFFTTSEASENKEVLAARADLARLYEELLSFKDSKEFSEDADNDLDVCGIAIKKNAINKEFDE